MTRKARGGTATKVGGRGVAARKAKSEVGDGVEEVGGKVGVGAAEIGEKERRKRLNFTKEIDNPHKGGREISRGSGAHKTTENPRRRNKREILGLPS